MCRRRGLRLERQSAATGTRDRVGGCPPGSPVRRRHRPARGGLRHGRAGYHAGVALLRTPVIGALLAFAGRLRFPLLFAISAALFLIDLVVPDVIPYADEVLLGLGVLVLSRWKKHRERDDTTDPPAS